MTFQCSLFRPVKSLMVPACRRLATTTISPKEDSSGKSEPKKAKTPIGKLDDHETQEGNHPFQEKEPLQAFPNNVNPTTGEIGGPKGPEPTRYGDWERKGRVSDF